MVSVIVKSLSTWFKTTTFKNCKSTPNLKHLATVHHFPQNVQIVNQTGGLCSLQHTPSSFPANWHAHAKNERCWDIDRLFNQKTRPCLRHTSLCFPLAQYIARCDRAEYPSHLLRMCTAKVWAKTNTDAISGGLTETRMTDFNVWNSFPQSSHTPNVSVTEENFSQIFRINNHWALITPTPVGSKWTMVLLTANVF